MGRGGRHDMGVPAVAVAVVFVAVMVGHVVWAMDLRSEAISANHLGG